MLVGGIALNFGRSETTGPTQGSSYRVGKGRDFVIEGDEYDSAFFDKTAKFLKYLPDIAVINNIEFDHADIYADLDAVLTAFRRLVRLVPRNGLLLIGADSPACKALVPTAVSPVETFGLDERRRGVDRQLSIATGSRGSTSIATAHCSDDSSRHCSVRTTCATRWRRSRSALASASRRRRSSKGSGSSRASSAGSKPSAWPTASPCSTISLTIRRQSMKRWPHCAPAIRDAGLWAVFEPRSASSCRRIFQDDFAKAFGAADEVVFAAVFRSSLPEAERLSAEQLVDDLTRQGRHARHIPEIDDIVSTIVRERRDGDVVVLMSNGGFGGIHGKLLQALRE
jgi:UDP-N-acetylmuramate: L-alanyl-gamma-D-glutamyl-meso-diaminopimelate ligase